MRTVLRIVTVLCTLWPAVAAAQDPARERVRRAQVAIASSLDPALPDVALVTWLRQVVGSSARYEWTAGSCAGQRERDNPAVPLCGVVAAQDSDVTVTVGVRLGEYLQDARIDRWATPRLDAAFVSRRRDLVMLDRLSELAHILHLRPEEWPRPEIALESARCVPERPQPDEPVSCGIAVANNGDAPSFARVFVDNPLDRSRSGDAVVRLDAGARKTARTTFPWPHEQGAAITAGVELSDRTPYHRVNERGELTLTRGEDLDTPAELLGWEDDDHALQAIVSARVGTGGGSRIVDVPVDSSIESLLVSIESLPGVTATLLRPGGARVREMDGDVRISDLKTMDLEREIPANLRLYTIAKPQPGEWHVAVSGADGPVLVKALGNSPIALDSFEFVRLQEGVHGGYFEIDGMPLAGVPATAEARVSHGPDEAAFRLVDEGGNTLRSVRLLKGQPDTADADLLGTFELPAAPFRAVMDGIDASGTPIQRQYPVTFRAQPVAVFFTYGISGVVEAGTSRRFTFAVTNVGTEAATFALSVKTTLGDVLDLSPPIVTVQPATSATSSFSLAIPGNAERPGHIDIRITATSTADTLVKNGASASLEVAREDDADNDSIEDFVDNCRDAPNHDQRDANRNGIGDACDPAGGGALSVRRLSPESGPPGTVVKIAGTGFSAAEPPFVLFNGVPVPAVALSTTELTFTVPAGAAMGPVLLVVGTEKGFAMSPMPFIVRAASLSQ
jgi:hypothetical protein